MAQQPKEPATEGNALLVRALCEADDILGSLSDWQDRLERVLEGLGELVSFDLAAVLVTDKEDRLLLHQTGPLPGEYIEVAKQRIYDHYEQLTIQPLRLGDHETVVSGPCVLTDRQDPDTPSTGEHLTLPESYLSVPLLGPDQVVGMLHICCQSRDAYDVTELGMASLVASKLGSYLAHLRLYRALEQLHQERGEMMEDLAHEVKNPLTSAYGFSQVLQRRLTARAGAISQQEAEMMESICSQVRRAVDTLDATLKVARSGLGNPTQKQTEVELTQLARSVAAAIQPTTDKHTITVEAKDDYVVRGYGSQLEQVFRNLLTNAVKYSPRGCMIEVRLSSNPGDRRVTVAVRDQGEGISREHLKHLFKRYYRADTATTQGVGGNGLGLYISRDIVTRHNGRIWVESEEGKGSTFYFRLPLA